MGLLDQVMGGMRSQPHGQKPGLGETVAAGVLLALLVKGVRSYQASHPAPAGGSATPQPQPQPDGGEPHAGGILGGLGGGGLGGGGLGGLLGGLGGAGALGSLISQLQRNGFGQQVGSWLGHGANQPIAPTQVAQALGDDTIATLQQQTGMPREALLADLSHVLPQALDELSPNGRAPTDDELNQIAAASKA